MRVRSFDGVELAVRDEGAGRPVILVHGFLSTSRVNWEAFGTARALNEAGFRTLLPDLRGHGDSDAPTIATAYPPDVLALDLAAIVRHFELTDYDLVGYSLGARTVVRAVVAHHLAPRRMILGGMGATGIIAGQARAAWFVSAIAERAIAKPLSEKGRVARFLASTGTDPDAAMHIMGSYVETTPEMLRAIATPTLVLAGRDDHDNGSAEELARLLPAARFQEIPGDHMSAVTRAEFRQAIVDFLSA